MGKDSATLSPSCFQDENRTMEKSSPWNKLENVHTRLNHGGRQASKCACTLHSPRHVWLQWP